MSDPQTTPAFDLQERVARLEKLVDHLYGKGEKFPSPLIPSNPLSAGECFMCGGIHQRFFCPLMQGVSRS